MNIFTDITPFEPIIIKAHYNGFNWNKLKPVCENMINMSPSRVHIEGENGLSSVSNPNQPHLNRAFDDFYEWLYPIAMQIITKEWGLMRDFEYIIGNSWVNVHNKGGITNEHHHGSAVLVVATYLNLPNNSGYIQFKDPNEYVKGFHLHEEIDDWCWKTVEARTGDVLLFPGWLRHRTQPSNSLENRWVLTTNIMNSHKIKK